MKETHKATKYKMSDREEPLYLRAWVARPREGIMSLQIRLQAALRRATLLSNQN